MTYKNFNKESDPLEKEETELSLPKVERTYDNLFSQITKLDPDDLIVNGKCKFCLHPSRIEAELLYEKTCAYPPIQKFFDKLCDQDPTINARMTPQNIRNHLLNHYTHQERKIWLREYGERMRAFIDYKVSKDRMFEGMVASLEMKLMDIASDPTLDPVKQADVMTKITKILLEITVAQARLKGELKTVNVVMEKFMNIWVHLIARQRDEDVKSQLMSALDTFQEQMEGISLSDDD